MRPSRLRNWRRTVGAICGCSLAVITCSTAVRATAVEAPSIDLAAIAIRAIAVVHALPGDVYGGVTYDESSNTINIQTTQVTSLIRDAIRAIPSGGAHINLISVPKPLDVLDAFHDAVESKWKSLQAAGVMLNEFYSDATTGKERLGVVDLSPSGRDLLNTAFGADNVDIYSVSAEAAASTHAASSPRTTDSSPWNGGDRLYGIAANGDGAGCTSGYGIKIGSVTRVLTAGHCYPPGNTVYNNDPGAANPLKRMGDVTRSGLVETPTDLDSELIAATPYGSIWRGTPGNAYGAPVSSAIVGNGKGLSVCQSGMYSGEICGFSVTAFNFCKVVDTMNWCHLVKAEKPTGTAGHLGDSGGPVFHLSGGTLYASGTTSALDVDQYGASVDGVIYYTGIGSILDHFNGTIVAND